MERIEGTYSAATEGSQVVVRSANRVVCNVNDDSLETAKLIASALNLWDLGSEDDTLDQLAAAHQMNLALSKRMAQMQEQIELMQNQLPANDGEDYGDNLIETGKALLTKAGKGGSYDLAEFDSAKITAVDVSRTREQLSEQDCVTIRAEINLRKRCIKSGEYDHEKKRGDIRTEPQKSLFGAGPLFR